MCPLKGPRRDSTRQMLLLKALYQIFSDSSPCGKAVTDPTFEPSANASASAASGADESVH